jgi:Na+/melibiose symporter-like transporter
MELIFLFFFISTLVLSKGIKASERRGEFWTNKFMSQESHYGFQITSIIASAISLAMILLICFINTGERNSRNIDVDKFKWEYYGEYKIEKNNGNSVDFYFASPEGVKPLIALVGDAYLNSPVYAYKGKSIGFGIFKNLFLNIPIYYYTTEKDDYLLMVNRSIKPFKTEQ